MRPLALGLIALLLLTGCSTTLTNVVGQTRTCEVPGAAVLAACTDGRSCLILGAVIGAVALTTAGFYAYCIHRAHEEGYE